MIYTIDTEFMEDGRTIELLSLALVAEDGRELYIENPYVDVTRANNWVREHVFPHLHLGCADDGHDCPLVFSSSVTAAYRQMRQDITEFCGPFPIFWGYYSAYDWVALCQFFGPMVDLPTGWPMYCHDLRSWLDLCGFPHITQPDDMPHHALSDARWIMETWKHYYEGKA